MLRAKAQILIRRPTGQLYDLVASEFFQNSPRWSLEVMELELTSPGPVRIGTTGSQVHVWIQGRRRRIPRFGYPDSNKGAALRFSRPLFSFSCRLST